MLSKEGNVRGREDGFTAETSSVVVTDGPMYHMSKIGRVYSWKCCL